MENKTQPRLAFWERLMTTFYKILRGFLFLSIWNNVIRLVRSRYVIYGDRSRFKLSKKARIENAIVNVTSGDITIEDYVFFGYNVCLLTGSHDYTKFGKERMSSVESSGKDIIIKKGVWLATNVTVLGPCVIGENAVVAAGSVVRDDVPPYTIVGGIPARVIKTLRKNRR